MGEKFKKERQILDYISMEFYSAINDTEDNFKLNFIMIAKRVLEKEKKRR